MFDIWVLCIALGVFLFVIALILKVFGIDLHELLHMGHGNE